LIRICYNQSSFLLRNEAEFLALNNKNIEISPILKKLIKREDFLKKNKETQNFIVFILDKTIRPRQNLKKMSLYEYLSERKINSNNFLKFNWKIKNKIKTF